MKKKKIICIMLILIFTSGIVIGAIQLYKQYHEYSEGAYHNEIGRAHV